MSRRRRRTSFTNHEYFDIFRCFTLANDDAVEAQRMYQDRYPNRVIPEASLFSEVNRRLRETGRFREELDDDPDRPIEERIRFYYYENSTIHMRTVAQHLNTSLWKIWHTVYNKITNNLPNNRTRQLLKRKQVSQFLYDADMEDANFLTSILWTGETKFTKESIMNQKTKAVKRKKAKKQTSKTNKDIFVNVLLGIAKNNVYGPYFLADKLTESNYVQTLQQLTDDLPIDTRRSIIYQNDGSPKYFGQCVKDYLNEKFPNKWIGEDGPIPWQRNSPEITPLEYHVWPKINSLVYDSSPITTVDELKDRITKAVQEINKSLTIKPVEEDMRKRLRVCIRHNGTFTLEQLMDDSD